MSDDAGIARGTLHHVELWVPSFSRAHESFGWLLASLNYKEFQTWELGESWLLKDTYIVFEESRAMNGRVHHRLHPGLNHLAFHVGTRAQCDALIAEALQHGWELLFPEKHPHAGGTQHYAGYMVNSDGFEIELVADDVKLGTSVTI